MTVLDGYRHEFDGFSEAQRAIGARCAVPGVRLI